MPVDQNIERLCLRARQAFSQRDWVKAKQVYLQALGLRSDLPDVHYGLATVYFQLREMTSAAHHFREVTRLDPRRVGAFVNLGAVLNHLQQYDEAVTALRKAIQLDAKRAEAYYNLGLVYKRKGDVEMAIQAYREALRLDSRMADAHLNLANIFLEREQLRQAHTHYEKALELRPGWEKALQGLDEIKELEKPEEQEFEEDVDTTIDDPDRLVDPNQHGPYLVELHQAAIDSDGVGRQFEQVLARDLDPAIKELATCLLYSGSGRFNLSQGVEHFESALDKLREIHQTLQNKMAHLRDLATRFPTS